MLQSVSDRAWIKIETNPLCALLYQDKNKRVSELCDNAIVKGGTNVGSGWSGTLTFHSFSPLFPHDHYSLVSFLFGSSAGRAATTYLKWTPPQNSDNLDNK